MTQTILLKRSAVAAKIPTVDQLATGELSVNTHDGKLYALASPSGTPAVVEIGGATLTGDVTGTISGQAGALTLAPSGILAGTYNGITFDAKGRALSSVTPNSGSYSVVLSSWTLVSGSMYSATVTHNLGTLAVSVDLWDTTTNLNVSADSIVASSPNTLTLTVYGNTASLRCVVVSYANSVVAANAFAVQDSGVAVGASFNTLNFVGAINVSDGGNGVAVIANPVPLKSFTYFAGGFSTPANADWAVNANAGVAVDASNAGINTQVFSNTVEQGVGLNVSIPQGAVYATFRVRGRSSAAQSGASVVQHKVYSRQLGSGAAMAAWSAPTNLSNVPVPANAYYQTNSQTVTLASLGLSAGAMYQLELTRAITVSGGTQLPANWLVVEVTVEFTA